MRPRAAVFVFPQQRSTSTMRDRLTKSLRKNSNIPLSINYITNSFSLKERRIYLESTYTVSLQAPGIEVSAARPDHGPRPA
jgi:hypothetical protein